MLAQDTTKSYFANLNPEQADAVATTEGALLVLAGAGTGKTRVLTTRITHILGERKAFPSQILAVTFTNKAAREMRDRIEKQLEGTSDGLWLGTFHAIAAKILRRHAECVGLTRDFQIIDMEDQARLIKQLLRDFNIDDKKNSPKLFSYLVGRFKDKAYSVKNIPSHENSGFADGRLLTLYDEYQKRLKQLNACDFGDLLLYNIELFNNHPEVYAEYLNKFKYILVDEYQDTNVAQYIWLRLLAKGSGNICCVGDDDQSIYGWRGAEVTNILKFDKDFVGAKIIRLEQNYRSTNHILSAATQLISNNAERHGKSLWTNVTGGNKIKLSSFYDDREEARYIAEEIEYLKHPLSEVAILVRAGYQTRCFEESFNYLRIPYRIIGGLKFYERAEIKDVLAYMRVIINRNDDLAFERIINTPRRGVGGTSIQNMYLNSRSKQISLYTSAIEMIESGVLKGKVATALLDLFNNFGRWREMLKTMPHWQVIDNMLLESGYIEMWKTEGTDESRERLDNIKELVRTLEDYNDLTEYLEHVSLVSDADNISDDEKVSIMTMHAAKGLEFKTVFLAGWEEAIFPSQKSIDESGQKGIEEERRLAYVGITRAKENLHVSYCNNRRIYGSFQTTFPSRFIDELPSSHVEIVNNFQQSFRRTEEFRPVKPPKKEQGMRPGSRVIHDKFGYGIIINLANNIAQVAFEKSDVKKVLVDYLKIS